MSIENFIDSLASGNKAEAEEYFNAEMGARVQDALDARKVEIGQSIYGGAEESFEEE